MYNYNIIQSIVNTKKRKNIFYFYPLTTSLECVIICTLTPKKLSRFVSSGKGHRFYFDAVAFSVVPKNHFIIFLFLRLSIGISQKIFFIFPLDKAGKSYIMYAVCFTWIVCHVLQMVDKRPFSFEDDLFLFQNLQIIARSVQESMPKFLEKIFYFSY